MFPTTERMVRIAKIALVFSMGLFALLAGGGNILDPATNFAFVQHVLAMDTVFPDNPLAGRAITSGTLHWLAFGLIVVVELAIAVLCLWGGVALLLQLSAPAAAFNRAKAPAVAGLTLGVVLWFTGFVVIGGEWFLMWQSETWNGIAAASRFAVAMFLTLLLVALADRDPVED